VVWWWRERERESSGSKERGEVMEREVQQRNEWSSGGRERSGGGESDLEVEK